MKLPIRYLDRAYATAYFIHDDPLIARSVVMEAIELFNSRARSPRLRRKARANKAPQSKLKLPSPILLQRCVWQASTYFERRQEKEQFQLKGKAKMVRPMSEIFLKLFRPAEDYRKLWRDRPLTEMDMAIRYVKSLALFSLERGPEFVAVALGCLFYDYSREEAQKVYDLTSHKLKKPEVKHPLQNHRGRLMKLLEARFKGLCQVQSDGRGMKSFLTQPGSPELLAVARESLDELSLWGTDCGRRGDVWLQLHTFFHLPCHDHAFLHRGNQKLQTRRLALPVFLTQDANSAAARRHPPKLSPEEIKDLIHASKSIGGRRKKIPAKSLLIAVDGEEALEIDLSEQSSALCELEPEARLVQVYARSDEDDLLLATCWLAELDGDDGETITVSHTAEGGQVVRFDIAFAEDGATTVEISYRETSPVRWLALEWRRLAYRLAAFQFKPATALAIGAILVGLIALSVFWLRQKPNQLPEIVRPASPTAQPSPTGAPHDEPPLLAENRGKPGNGNRGLTGQRNSTRRTRGLPLSSVARIYIQPFGEDQFGTALREGLIDRLKQSPLSVEEQMLPATDAVLQWKANSPRRLVRLRLVNKAGEVLWQASFKQIDAQQISELAVKELLAAIEAEKRKTSEKK